MRKTASVIMAAALAWGAAAQAEIPRSLQLLDSRYDPGNARGNVSDRVECLIRKSNHHRVCHTLDGWRQVARQIDREQARNR